MPQSLIDWIPYYLQQLYNIFCYHRTCYADFTNKSNISRLKQRYQEKCESNTSVSEASHSRREHVSRATPSDWKMCIFCQSDKKEHLRQVLTFNMNSTINDFASLDYKLHLRIAGVGDLIAAEARYHSSCLIEQQRLANKARENVQASDTSNLSFLELCHELHISADKGHVLQLSDVWDRYLDLAEGCNDSIPQSFTTRRSTFKEKLESSICNIYQFHQPLDRDKSDRHMLLIPTKFKHTLSAAATQVDSDEFLMPTYQPNNSEFHSIVHAALQIRKDLTNTPGHKGLKVSKDGAKKVIPESLHLFLSIVFGGQGVLDEILVGESDDEDANIIMRMTFELQIAKNSFNLKDQKTICFP